MSTKAQAFRAQQQRDANPPVPKQPARPRRDVPVDTAKPGISATDRKAGNGSSGSRNISASAGKRGGARLEDSATGKPSRKSTRKSAGRVKRTSNLRRKAVLKASSPQGRAAKANGGKKK